MLFPGQDLTEVERSIAGLSEEDEFALMCRLMGTATHMIRLEQNPIIQGDYIVPDFLAGFRPGCSVKQKRSDESVGFKCLVEVKSTDKDKFKIGGSVLKRRRNFARDLGLPLLIAVRFLRFSQNALWAIVEDDPQVSSLTVSVTDFLPGVRHVIWDEYFYFLKPGLQFRTVFDPTAEDLGAWHHEYGNFKEFHIMDGDAVTELKGIEALMMSCFCNGFKLAPLGFDQRGTATVRTSAPRLAVCSIADMLYSFNTMPTEAAGQSAYDASKIIAAADQGAPEGLVTRKSLDNIAAWMLHNGLAFIFAFGESETHFAKWRQFGGQ